MTMIMSSSELIDCIIAKRDLEEVRRILNSGVDVNYKCKVTGNTALAFCCEYALDSSNTHGPDVVKLLIAYGADINAVNNHKDSVLIKFLDHTYNKSYIQCLLNAGGIDVAYKGMFGDTALHHCSWFNHFGGEEIINMLKHAGSDTDLLTIQNNAGQTPMMRFIQAGSPIELVKLVYDKNMDINLKDISGNTALHLCCIASSSTILSPKNSSDTLKFLFEKGADLNIKSKSNLSPVMRCIKEQRNLDVLKLLLYQGAVIDHEASFRACYRYCKDINYLNTLFKFMLLNKNDHVDRVVEMHRSLMTAFKSEYENLNADIEQHLNELNKLKTIRFFENGATLYNFCMETNKRRLGSYYLSILNEDIISAFTLYRELIDFKLEIGRQWGDILFKIQALSFYGNCKVLGEKSVTLNSHFLQQLIIPLISDSDMLNLVKAAENTNLLPNSS